MYFKEFTPASLVFSGWQPLIKFKNPAHVNLFIRQAYDYCVECAATTQPDSQSMQDSQQQERKVSGGDLPSLTNQAGTDCDKVNCESSGAIGQQAPTKSSRRSRSFIPYLFDPRSSAPNEDGDHSMFHTTAEFTLTS